MLPPCGFWSRVHHLSHGVAIALVWIGTSLYAVETPPPPARATTCLAGNGEAVQLVNGWYAAGTAAGNTGDWYDNRDRGHSMLNLSLYPQLQRFIYSEAESKQNHDWALTVRSRPQVTIGNSSTATSVGSNPRVAYLAAAGVAGLYAQYRANNLYFYPEHRDYDPGHNGLGGGFGDLFPINTPYVVISQGSSGSDQVFMHAFTQSLAAFQPETKRRLIEKGLLMPALQFIFRTSNKQVQSAEDYLTGKAHPPVFQGTEVDAVAMVRKAHDLAADALPPLVQLTVTEEDAALIPCGSFEVSRNETICDTPCAIGRIFRRLERSKRIVVSAKGSLDPQGGSLTYSWVVLRGDPEQIRISTSEQGAVAEIVVRHQPRRPIAPASAMASNRVDIGVFARNAGSYSAPAFISVLFPANELRTYDDHDRLIDVTYAGGDTRISHAGDQIISFTGGPRYPITDWSAALDLILSQREDFAARLLRGGFSAVELQAIGGIASDFAAAKTAQQAERDAQELKWKDKEQAAAGLRKNVETAAKTRAEAAALANAEGASAETKAQLLAAEKELARLTAEHDTAGREGRDENRKLEGFAVALGKVLLTVDPRLGMSAKDRIEKALNAIKDDPRLYLDHLGDVTALCQTAETAKAVMEARRRLSRFGLFPEDAQAAPELKPTQVGAPLRLTACEEFEIQRFHLLLLSRVLYPQFLQWRETLNYADERLVHVRDLRDVYHYDAAGRLTGWTRYQPDARADFIADGRLVTDADAQGRPRKVRPVQFFLEKAYRDGKAGNRLAGYLRYDGTAVGVYDAQDRMLVDPEGDGKGVRPGQVQFLVFEQKAGYVIDVNHVGADQVQTGWTRYDQGAKFEYTCQPDGTFAASDGHGGLVGAGTLKYQVPPSPGVEKMRLVGEEQALPTNGAVNTPPED